MEGMSVDEAYILSLYNDSLSYLSLLNYGAATAASEHPPPPYTTFTINHHPHLLQHQHHQLMHENDQIWKKMKREHAVKSASENARRRRRMIGEKTRCLQKLLPWNTKMDTATMLGEAAKYVKFLQAQICVLSSMPMYTPTSATYSSASSTCYEKEVGTFPSLNREELLAVMVNSQEIQTVLSRNGWCLYTVEQKAALLDADIAVSVSESPPDHVLPEYMIHGMLQNYF